MPDRTQASRTAALVARVAARHLRAYDVADAPFNLFEIAKQAALLEMHFAFPNCACNDCILKHLLTIEGLCEEMANLDGGRELVQQAFRWAQIMREQREAWMKGVQDVLEAAAFIRAFRKEVTRLACEYAKKEWAANPTSTDPRTIGSACRVAHRYVERVTCPRCASCR